MAPGMPHALREMGAYLLLSALTALFSHSAAPLRRAAASALQPLVGSDWILLHQQQAEGHHQHACNKSEETIVPFAVSAARGQ